MPFLLRILLVSVCAALFVSCCLLVAKPIYHLTERSYIRPVAPDEPPALDFPVLVVWPSGQGWQARVLPFGKLEEFRRKQSGDQLTVPQDRVGEVQQSIDQWLRTDPHAPRHAGFQVLADRDGHQSLKVEFNWDERQVNVGWYEVSGEGITPQQHLFYYFPGLLMAVLPLAFLITLGLWVSGYLFLVRWRGGRAEIFHRGPREESTPEGHESHGLESLRGGGGR